MLLNNLSVTALSWSSGPCHLSQVQLWIRVHVYSISSVLLLSCVVFFATPWTAALQASLSMPSRSLLRLKSIESMMLSNNPILGCALLLPSFFSATWSFPMSQLFASHSPSIGASASASVLPMNTQERFTLGLTCACVLHSPISLDSFTAPVTLAWSIACAQTCTCTQNIPERKLVHMQKYKFSFPETWTLVSTQTSMRTCAQTYACTQ